MTMRFAEQRYELACSEPMHWLDKAREVRRAADLVWDVSLAEANAFAAGAPLNGEPLFSSVALMLYGFVIENLLKAGLVALGRGRTPGGRFDIKSHKLEDLADQLTVQLDGEDRELLERLEAHLEWAGRYPIPLLVTDLAPRRFLDGSGHSIAGIISSLDRQRIDALIARIQTHLPSDDEAVGRVARRLSPTAEPVADNPAD